MIINVELDDTIYNNWISMFPEGFDLGIFLGDLCKSIVILMATNPKEFYETFGPEALDKLPESTRHIYEQLKGKHLPGIR